MSTTTTTTATAFIDVGHAQPRPFPTGFVWGAATSSFQIEGAPRADGKGESIWDRFCATPGKIADGSDGSVACDHFHRSTADVALMADLGLNSYRFSVAWSRVVPDASRRINTAGLDFYDRLVDDLLAAGIDPSLTLYHWDLPQWLEDAGGWPTRTTAEAFVDYTTAVVHRLGDRVNRFTTVNEPFVIANLGYLTGEHAPGRKDLRAALAASHHVLLAHGLGLQVIRELAPHAEGGITVNFTPVEPVGDSPFALDRQRVQNEYENRWYSDPVAGRGYPAFTVERLAWDQAEVRDGDMALIAAPIDFFGVNFYTRKMVGAIDGERIERGAQTTMGWEIHPPALGDLLLFLHDEYRFPKIFITENGAAMPDDRRTADGRVADHDRLAYVRSHLDQVLRAIDGGVPVAGYFAWSLLDNFEWAFGYVPRFGLVEVDFETQQRTPKLSALWYSDVARTNTLIAPLQGD